MDAVTPLLEHQCGLRVKRSRTLQSLWAGYGKALEVEAQDSEGTHCTVVVKHVTPPSGRRYRGDVGHERKLKSYQVEAVFYRHVAPVLLQRGHPAIATPLAVDSDPSTGRSTLVLSDLRQEFSSPCHGDLDMQHAKAALSWLASLHAAHFDKPLPEGLWEEGCYWHLATRLDELDGVKRGWKELGDEAHAIDQLLRTGAPRTLVHGDAKSENFLFRVDRASGCVTCAAYDFQYTGAGDAMKDVAYLLCSSVDSRVLRSDEETLLRHYYDGLVDGIGPDAAATYTYEFCKERFELALLDYVRWMQGWGFWGASDWAVRKARVTLNKVKQTQSKKA